MDAVELDDADERLISGEVVARRLDVSRATVAKMVRNGTFIPPAIESYAFQRWRERDVNAWIAARAVPVAKIAAAVAKSLAQTKRSRS